MPKKRPKKQLPDDPMTQAATEAFVTFKEFANLPHLKVVAGSETAQVSALLSKNEKLASTLFFVGFAAGVHWASLLMQEMAKVAEAVQNTPPGNIPRA